MVLTAVISGTRSAGAALALCLAAAFSLGPDAPATPGADAPCPVRTATEAYKGSVARATRSGRDVWGEQLLAAPQGPTYAAARRLLAPLRYGQRRGRQPLTPSGVYYLAFSHPRGATAPTSYALHVADGSQIVSRRLGQPSLRIFVGRDGRERYGACPARLAPARLVRGYLPILRTAYVDRGGVRYQQESFAVRAAGVRSLVSYVRHSVDARSSRAGALLRLSPSLQGRAELGAGSRTRLWASAGGRCRGEILLRVPRGRRAVVYVAWANTPAPATRLRVAAAVYSAKRREVERFWERRLAQGARISVPERVVQNAQRSLVVQQLGHVWRYSVGNPYEELSFAEALDAAEVMAGYGYRDVARVTLQAALERLPRRFTAWRAGETLVAVATYHRLHRDRAFLRTRRAALAGVLARLESRRSTAGTCAGRLQPERLCSDVAEQVDSVTSNLVAWQGLLASSRVWAVTGEPRLAARARRFAVQLEASLRPAIRAALVPLSDGSLFLPATFSGSSGPYWNLTDSRDGSYWNLVVPYGIATGFFRPRGPEARGLIRYLLGHGSRLLGLARADAHVIYGNEAQGIASGVVPAYGLSVARLLADDDRPDQLVLSLYGQLAAGMTPGTHVSGEGVSVTPLGDAYHRTTYMPPNGGANVAFLENLRLMLVHERRGPRGAPVALDLAFSTPRPWLRPGRTISVQRAPTSFGRVSFSLRRRGDVVVVRVTPPREPTTVQIRLRLPRGERLARVVAAGRPVAFEARSGTIRIRGTRPVELRATVATR